MKRTGARASRREILSGLAAPALLAHNPGLASDRREDPLSAARLQASLERYEAAGVKSSGGPGDEETGAWLAGVLRMSGFTPFAPASTSFPVPFFDPRQQSLEIIEGARAPVRAQSVVVQTPADGITAPLTRRSGLHDGGDSSGAIALVDLPSGRRGDIDNVAPMVKACSAAGAVAVVLVTNGPTREAQMLNAPGDHPIVSVPVCIMAPKDAAPFLKAAATRMRARLHIVGTQGHRPARNVVGTIDRGAKHWIVVTTPRSGWTYCAGERGPGVAIWTALAQTLPNALPNYNLMFAALSGHEHHGPGTTLLIDHAPPPAATALWVHLGGNLAVRDWHEAGDRLLPLPSADPQRYIVGADAYVPALRTAFAGVTGLEQAYPASAGVIGDYVEIHRRGYTRSFAGFGVTRFHHTEADRLATQTSGALTEPVARGFDRAIRAVAGL